MGRADRYETDYYAWAMEQAELLRAGRLSDADIANIAEEIESMGRSEKRELLNRLEILLTHLLKWQVQSALRGNSWTLTIREQRRKLDRHLQDNPSLRAILDAAIPEAYGDALIEAQQQTGLPESAFPAAVPWTREQVLSDGFLPT